MMAARRFILALSLLAVVWLSSAGPRIPWSGGSIVTDPIVIAVALGLLASVVAGKALVYGVQLLPQRWHRTAEWLFVGGAATAAIAGHLWSQGPAARVLFVFLIAALPGIVAFLAWRTVLASALVSLLPLYFGIGALTAGRTIHMPAVALDRWVSVQPAWMFVYGSIYVFVLLPLLVVRQQQLLRCAMKAYVMVLIVAYAGFLAYPTIAPRPAVVPAVGFLAWCLRLVYALDSPYNCFPSLHVAHSFVSALACYRVHRGVGFTAALWAALIAVSALYVRQHFVVDLIAGALAAWVAYALFLRSYPREFIPEVDRRLAPGRALTVTGIFGMLAACAWLLYATKMIVV
jgi:membrane-associated phospholipid phosphatase